MRAGITMIILKILFRDKSKVNVQQYSAIIHQLSYDMPVYM